MKTADDSISKFYLEDLIDLSKKEIGFLCLVQRGLTFYQATKGGQSIIYLNVSYVRRVGLSPEKVLELLAVGLGFIKASLGPIDHVVSTVGGLEEWSCLYCTITERGRKEVSNET